jgi:2-methylisocitrate lyase-like PEP mutase family enzyme
VIIARTDSRDVLGIDQAIKRAKAYVDAGADAIFVEAPTTKDELKRVGGELAGVPLIVNIVEGGLTPELGTAELHDMGYTIILFANFLMRCMIKAGIDALSHLHATGETASYSDKLITWDERQSLVDLPGFENLEQRFARWQPKPQPGEGGDVS